MKKIIELFKYGIFGAITTAINLALFFGIDHLHIMYYLVANTIAYFIAVVINYVLNRYFVFEKNENQNKTDTAKQFGKFVLLRVVSLGVDNLLFYLLVSKCHLNKTVSRIGLSFVIIMITYVINKLFIFNSKGNENEKLH